MGDGLQLHFVLLLCLKFCHGMNFFVQEALKTVREGDTFNIYSDPMEKKMYPVPLRQGNLLLEMRSIEANVSGGTSWLGF